MQTENSSFIKFVSYMTVFGNLIFVLWILFNGIKENFEGTLIEKVSYAGLMGLLISSSILILRKSKN